MPQIDPKTGEVVQPQGSIQIDPNTGEVVTPSGGQQSNATPVPSEHSIPQEIGSTLKDLGTGVLKGAGSTANSLGHLIVPDWAVKMAGGKPPSEEQQQSYFAPKNTAQSIGKSVEQAGEFLVPGGAEEEGAEAIAKMAPKLKPLARVGMSALSSGAVNKAQGGGFGTGAVAGGIGAGVGAGLKAMAPGLAEGALRIQKLDRAYGRRPGEAALNETGLALRPSKIAARAQGVLNDINPELERIVGNGGTSPVNLQAPLDVIHGAQNTAIARNAAGSYQQLQPMERHLTEEFATGQPISRTVTPRQALDLKRGFGDEFVHNWNPETMSGTRGTAARTYGKLADEIHTSVPGSKALDERASSLIPVAKRAESLSRNAGLLQNTGHRLAAHTGAATLGGLGAYSGYRENGLNGALAGGLIGALGPEILASPEAEMGMARTLNSSRLPKVLVGTGLGGLRGARKGTDQ